MAFWRASRFWTDAGIEERDAAWIKTGWDKGLVQPHEGSRGGLMLMYTWKWKGGEGDVG